MLSSFMAAFQPKISKPRNRFRKMYSHLTTIKTDYIYPVFIKQYYPGDTVRGNIHAFGRLQPLIRPIFDQLQMDFYAFECPNRILWPHWPNMMGVRRHRDDSIAYTVPMGTHTTNIASYDLAAYFGWPIGRSGVSGSTLPYRLYYKMWNEYFRDEDLQELLPEVESDTPEAVDDYVLQRANKMHDRFTSLMVDTQKGDIVEMPMGDTAPVIGDGTSVTFVDKYTGDPWKYTIRQRATDNNIAFSFEGVGQTLPYQDSTGYDSPHVDYVYGISEDPDESGMICDLSSATASTINELRFAFQLQAMLEIDQRYGTRINELIYGHWGVDVPDMATQRVAYIGGSSTKMSGQPIAQTYRSDAGETPQGTLTMNGQFNSQTGSFEKTFGEWSLLIVVCVVRAPLHYQQGLARMWKKTTREEHIWPELGNVGPQEVYSYEVYCDGSGDDNQVFAYENRYNDEREMTNMITGQFNSMNATPLDTFHLAQEWASRPQYNSDFIESDTPMSRVLAVTDEDHIFLDFKVDLTEDRILPMYGNPFQLSRF